MHSAAMRIVGTMIQYGWIGTSQWLMTQMMTKHLMTMSSQPEKMSRSTAGLRATSSVTVTSVMNARS